MTIVKLPQEIVWTRAEDFPENSVEHIPSSIVGGITFRNRARNCTPCVRTKYH